METIEKRPEQADLPSRDRRLDRYTRGPLSTLTLITLLGYALMNFVAFFRALLFDGVFVPPILVFAVLALLVAGIAAIPWRWTPLFGAGMTLLTLPFVLIQAHNIYVLTHPAQPEFMILVLFTAFGLVAIIAGVGATMRNYRGRGHEPGLPRGSGISLSGLAGIVVGMALVALIVTAVPQTGAVSASSNGEPTVHMTADHFAQNVVLVPKGSKLLIVSDSSVEHILQNGTWNASGTPQPLVESGAPTLHNVDITGGSQEVGPFTTAGVYHIYCTIHRGMNLTIVVQ
jgi:plastocyanin